MTKIVFSDYDGTLDTSEEDIVKNIEAINKFRKNGNLFVIATGRSYLDLKRKLDLYPIPFDYLIVNHGGVILDKKEQVIAANLIPKSIGSEILNSVKSNNDIEQIILFDTMKKDIKELSEELTKIMLEMKKESSARNLSDQLNVQYRNYVKSYVIATKNNYLVEIISITTDKGKAIEKIIEMENMNDKDVFTIGDGANDVEMILKYNGYGMKKSEDIVYKITNRLLYTVAELIETLN